ncbi:hypothetical protein [Halomonas stenophila]|uniref:Uncharacterized protein n=1 Tax=Halomonas stenophila TaxID=795312 RepID=A0A7W5EW10_9GAMM|nr:hypothetical protein [Halomonas stenophila]
MAIDRRTILAAIAAETAERSGPMPAWLVPIAVNAKSKAEQNAVDAELVALRAAGLIDYHRDGGTGSGLELTAEGRQALKDLNQGKPEITPQPKAEPKVKPDAARRQSAVSAVDQSPVPPKKLGQYASKPLTRQGSEVDESSPAPAPAPPPPPPEPPAPPADPERVDPEHQPELAVLLCDMAGHLADGLRSARIAGDLEQTQRLSQLARRLQRHTGGPRP